MLSGFLLPSRTADINLDFFEDGVKRYHSARQNHELDSRVYKEPFYPLLVNTTLFRLVARELQPLLLDSKRQPYVWSDTRRFFATLESLKRIPDLPEATFTFAHLIEPHEPVQLKRNGEKLAELTSRPKPAQFFAELELINEHLLGMLGEILEKSTTPPIIVLQADHGSDLGVSFHHPPACSLCVGLAAIRMSSLATFAFGGASVMMPPASASLFICES